MNSDEERRLRRLLGQRVKAARREKFGTVSAAIAAAKVSRTTWDNIEAGISAKSHTIDKVIKALDWPPDYADKFLAGVDPDILARDMRLRRMGLHVDLDLRPEEQKYADGVEGDVRRLHDELLDLVDRVEALERTLVNAGIDLDAEAVDVSTRDRDPERPRRASDR